MRERIAQIGRPARHGHSRAIAGEPTVSPTYSSWAAMKQRCYNPNDSGYAKYGGRGIVICDRWRHSFDAFLEDMGERPPHTTIDRIDSNGNYEPGNCRWADKYQQSRNRPTLVKLNEQRVAQIRDLIGIGANLRTIAKAFGVSYSVVLKIAAYKAWV